MAVLSKCLVVAFAALSVARPLAKRENVMVTETAYTTVDVPVTLWVNEQGQPISTQAQAGVFAEASPSSVVQSASPVAQVVPTTTPVANAVPLSPSPIQAYTPPASVQTYAAAPAPTTPAAVTTSAPVAAAPYTPPVAASSTPAAQAQPSSPAKANPGKSGQSGAVTGSSTASCDGEGAACSGDITHWDGGLGACGWNVNTKSDFQIALPHGFMGTQSNGNPYCGKSLTIMNPTTGQTAQATVGDKCMGCDGRSIDLTDALFDAVGGNCDGRCSGFTWWFN